MALLVSWYFRSVLFFIYLVHVAKSFIVPSTPQICWQPLSLTLAPLPSSLVIQWAFLSELDFCVQPGKGCVWKSESVQHPGWDGARPSMWARFLTDWQHRELAAVPKQAKKLARGWEKKKRLVFSQQKIPEFRRKSKEGFGRSQLQASSLLK